MLRKISIVLLFAIPTFCFAQKLKYKTDIDPILNGPKSIPAVATLETYYQQNLGPNGKPTSQTINYLRDKMTKVCLHSGRTFEAFAYENKDYPNTDTAIACLSIANKWYTRISEDFFIKSDTLVAHIAKLKQLQTQWKEKEQETVRLILAEKQTLNTNLERMAVYDMAKAQEYGSKYSSLVFLNEYKDANKDVKTVLKGMEYEKNLADQKKQVAIERMAALQEQMKHEKKQKDFLMYQDLCKKENPCPNCPLSIAKKFRDAYHAGDIMEMKKYIIDYYGDEKLFYNNDLNMFSEFSDEELSNLKLKFRAKTADFKIVDPVNVVYYTDNETKDFHIDKYYKSHFLHATVFKAINDYEKIDLIKYNGQWKVYRVGGAYGGRSGKTIINGRFFFDPKFLQKEVKRKTTKK